MGACLSTETSNVGGEAHLELHGHVSDEHDVDKPVDDEQRGSDLLEEARVRPARGRQLSMRAIAYAPLPKIDGRILIHLHAEEEMQ